MHLFQSVQCKNLQRRYSGEGRLPVNMFTYREVNMKFSEVMTGL